jgi:HEAT repeat protein
VLAALDDPDADVRRSACHAMEGLQLPPEQHLQRLIRILDKDPSTEVQSRAARQLPHLAERADISNATATLARFLSRGREIYMPICKTLGKIGPRAQAAVPALMEALRSEDQWIALEAAKALWNIERSARLILPTLDKAFASCGETVCDLICEMGPEARSLLPKLLDALAQDDYWDLQWAAADAIGHVASADQETMQALKKALSHESGIVRSGAANALGRLGEPALPILLGMLAPDGDTKEQEWVAHALARMGPPALPAVPLLREKLTSAPRGLRLWAAIALAKIASDADAVPALIEILEDEELADQWSLACDCLAAIGAPAAPAREILTALTIIPIDEIRDAAQLAIAAFDRQAS